MTATAALDFFSRSVRERLFVPQSSEHQRIGLEVEMLPQLTDSGLPCPLETSDGGTRSTLAFLRPYGASRGWRERRSAKGAPYFALPNGSTLTFEPGGQLELSTSATESISSLLRETTQTLTALRSAASDAGITLLSVGIDPENGIERVPLQLHVPRYVEMTRYFDRIGPSGVRMMRQTAATQVSVDPGAEPGERWRLLADLTPYLIAIFANSPRYAGEDTGWRSYRAQCWRQLDHSRTGIPHPELSAEEAYTRFALDAVDMTRADAAGEYRSFAEWTEHGEWTVSQWENHLTTLFPEVRPRGHLEIRSIDALAPEAVVAAVVIIAGIAYDERATREARAFLPPADEDMLNRAARCGLRDDEIARTGLSVAELGLAGAQTLGDGVVAGAELDVAREFVAEWTRCRRSPADGS